MTYQELVAELKNLNPDAEIVADDPVIGQHIQSSMPLDKLKMPEGFEYNAKNGITNKHNTQSGTYIAVRATYKEKEAEQNTRTATSEIEIDRLITELNKKFANIAEPAMMKVVIRDYAEFCRQRDAGMTPTEPTVAGYKEAYEIFEKYEAFTNTKLIENGILNTHKFEQFYNGKYEEVNKTAESGPPAKSWNQMCQKEKSAANTGMGFDDKLKAYGRDFAEWFLAESVQTGEVDKIPDRMIKKLKEAGITDTEIDQIKGTAKAAEDPELDKKIAEFEEKYDMAYFASNPKAKNLQGPKAKADMAEYENLKSQKTQGATEPKTWNQMSQKEKREIANNPEPASFSKNLETYGKDFAEWFLAETQGSGQMAALEKNKRMMDKLLATGITPEELEQIKGAKTQTQTKDLSQGEGMGPLSGTDMQPNEIVTPQQPVIKKKEGFFKKLMALHHLDRAKEFKAQAAEGVKGAKGRAALEYVKFGARTAMMVSLVATGVAGPAIAAAAGVGLTTLQAANLIGTVAVEAPAAMHDLKNDETAPDKARTILAAGTKVLAASTPYLVAAVIPFGEPIAEFVGDKFGDIGDVVSDKISTVGDFIGEKGRLIAGGLRGLFGMTENLPANAIPDSAMECFLAAGESGMSLDGINGAMGEIPADIQQEAGQSLFDGLTFDQSKITDMDLFKDDLARTLGLDRAGFELNPDGTISHEAWVEGRYLDVNKHTGQSWESGDKWADTTGARGGSRGTGDAIQRLIEQHSDTNMEP
ncbi:MAG: hypothetical protein FWE31_01900 [Firmicutes bacterium]|nr:hypothetical protein [Bacillota bacterium]